MDICKYCHTALPEKAYFCGQCGRGTDVLSRESSEHEPVSPSDVLDESVITAFSPTLHAEYTDPLLHRQPLSGSNPAGIADRTQLKQDKNTPPLNYNIPFLADAATEQVTPGRAPFVQGTPQMGGAPFVQSTPQMGGAPFVQGTPQMGGTPFAQSTPQAGGAPFVRKEPPAFHQNHTKAYKNPPTGEVRKAPHGYRPSSLTMVVATGIIVAAVTIALFIAYLTRQPGVAASPPAALAITGIANPGQAITLSGSHFLAGSKLSVTLDNQQLSQSHALNSMSVLQIILPGVAGVGTPVTVGSDGTFIVTVHIDPHWSIGSTHTLRVYDQSDRFIVAKDFTIVSTTPLASLASCTASTAAAEVNIGPVSEGQKQTVTTPFTLCTQGQGVINWSSNWDRQQAPWLQINQVGNIQAPQSQQIKLSTSPAGLKAGTYISVVTFTGSPGDTKTSLIVTLIVQARQIQSCIKASSQSLTFASQEGQGDPAPQTVTITNCGDTGNWLAVTSTDNGAGWLSASPSNGSIDQGISHGVSIKVANQASGTYKGAVTLSIGSKTVTIGVTLNVAPKPNPICVQPGIGTLTFQGTVSHSDPAAQSVKLSNGCDAGSWSAASDALWLRVSPASGQIGAHGSANVSVTAALVGLTAKSYTGHITFKAGSGTTTITVSLTVAPSLPCVTVNPGTLNFTETLIPTPAPGVTPTVQPLPTSTTYTQATPTPGASDAQSVTLSNGCDPGKWAASSDALWLNVDSQSGQLVTGGNAKVAIQVASGNLSAGLHTGHVTFNAGTSKAVVTVNVSVQLAQCLSAASDHLTFTGGDYPEGQDPAPQTFSLVNCGDPGSVSFSVATDNGGNWLSVTGNGGQVDTNGTLNLTITAISTSQKLAAGTYTGHIDFTIKTAGGSKTYRVPVTLNVTQASG